MKKIGSETPGQGDAHRRPVEEGAPFSAESTPMDTPANTQMTAAPTASDRVTGSRSSRSGHTGCRLMNE